jgi:beta-N-acetylhexosaminidase
MKTGLMDLRDIGRLFILGFKGTEFSRELKSFLEDLNPSGVVLFSRNIESPVQVAQLNHDLQVFGRASDGLFIGVDQEGGRVRRLKEGFTEFAPALELSSHPDPDASVRHFARRTAEELTLTGFNLDFAPVMDVIGSPENLTSSVIGDRSFGFDPDKVARLGAVVIREFRSKGIVPCCKHFPGHGGTLVDSHIDLPMDTREFESIERLDLVPFRSAAKMQVEMMMTAHVLYPSMDKLWPATLSGAILNGLLREKLSYDGVVITDDLDMGAVADRYSIEDACTAAFTAGADLLLICNNPEKAFRARQRIFEALKSGEIPESRLMDSITRIEKLKSAYTSSLVPCDMSAARNQFGRS